MTALLVTGLTGFVGSHLSQQAQAADLCLDGKPVDLRDPAAVLAAVRSLQPKAVIHLAAQSSVALSIDDADETYRVNFTGTLNLLRALRDAGFQGRMLFVGSGDVYGSVRQELLPVTEDVPLRPRNPYGVSKVAAEALCYQWSQSGPFEIVMARPFNHIGPGQSKQFAIADFASQVAAYRRKSAAGVAGASGSSQLRVGDITATRDFTDVRDMRAYLALLESGVNGEAYNVCSGVERSLGDIIEALFDAGGVRMDIAIDPQRLRPSEQRRMLGSFAKLRAHTGWEPRIELPQTLRDILAHCDEKASTP